MNRTQASRASGCPAAIRPAYPTDLPALSDFFAGLSTRTRYLRFFGPVTPSPALLGLLSGGADRVDAVVATSGGVIIGHAMAADRAGPQNPEEPRDPEEPLDPQGVRITDIGVVVADAWQGRGVGSALMRALITGAQARGVTSVAMDVLPDNYRVLAMIAAHWPAARTDHSPDCVTIDIRLPRHQQQRPRARPGRRARASRPAAAASRA
jgi:ribosomal protein S18 acetylase RimI-like enzyme